jgi:hypothetical protein
MRFGIALLAVFLSISAHVFAQGSSYTLDFQKGHNLKLVYDAGARPWKETNSTCMVGGNGMKDITHWKIVLPTGESFDYASNMANFEVMEDFDVGRIDFSGVDDISIQDAAAMTKAICTSLNIPLTGLDEIVAGLNPGAKFNEHPQIEKNGWSQRVKVGGVDFFVAFVAHPFMDHTSAQVNITLQWPNYPADDPTFSKGPLKHLISDLRPPPGYEGMSMAPPPRDPNQKGFPAHDLDYYKQKIDDFKKQQIAAGNVTAAQLAPQPSVVIPSVPGADYIAGQDYTYELPHKMSVWLNSGAELMDYDAKVRYLLQTDKELKTLKDLQAKQLAQAASPQAGWLLPGSIVRLDHAINTLDVVLVETYKEGEVKQWFKDHPNPVLLKEMLCHYYLFVHSQDARWPSVIDSLNKIDPSLNAEALSEVKAYHDANPN